MLENTVTLGVLKLSDVKAEEKKMLSTILAKLESIEAKIDEMNYPPEEAVREDFIRKVEAASKLFFYNP